MPGDVHAVARQVGNRAPHELVAGEVLPDGLRKTMEERLGADFSGVRVHRDEPAVASAESLSAKAYTVGTDIVFGEGRWDPQTRSGRWLLAHELAHVVQQSRGGPAPALDRTNPLEHEARAAADAVVTGAGPLTIGGAASPGVAREEDDEAPKKKAPKKKANKPQPKPEPGPTSPERKEELLEAARAANKDVVKREPPPDDPEVLKAMGSWDLLDLETEKRTTIPPPLETKPPVTPGEVISSQPRLTEAGEDAHLRSLQDAVVGARGFADSVGVGAYEDSKARLEAERAKLADNPNVATELARLKELRDQRAPLLRQRDELAQRRKELRTRRTEVGKQPASTTRDAELQQIKNELAQVEATAKSIRTQIQPIDQEIKPLLATEKQSQAANALQRKLAVSGLVDVDDPTKPSPGAVIGRGQNTYVVIQVIDADGTVVASSLAPNGGYDKANKRLFHAEQNAIRDLEKQLGGREVPGGRVVVVGDQVVCDEVCMPDVAGFARKVKAARADGYTFHSKDEGQADSDARSAKSTAQRTTEARLGTENGQVVRLEREDELVRRQKSIWRAPGEEPTPGGQGGSGKQTAATGTAGDVTTKPQGTPGAKAGVAHTPVPPAGPAPAAEVPAAPVVKPPAAPTPAAPGGKTAAADHDVKAPAAVPQKPPVAPLPAPPGGKAAVADPGVKSPVEPAPVAPAPKPPVVPAAPVAKAPPVPPVVKPPAAPAPAAPVVKPPAMPAPASPVVKPPAGPAPAAPATKTPAAPVPETPPKAAPKKPSAPVAQGHEQAVGALSKANTVLGALLEAKVRHQQLVDQGENSTSARVEASGRAALTLAGNLKGGVAGGAVDAYNSYERAIQAGKSRTEAAKTAVGTVAGSTLASKAVKPSVAGLVVEGVNTGAQLVGAPEEVQLATSGAAELVPGQIIARTGTAGVQAAFALADTIKGDTKSVDRLVTDWKKGGAGPWLQGYTQWIDIGVDVASGTRTFEQALNKAAEEGKRDAAGNETWASKVGGKLGTGFADLGENEAALRGDYSPPVQGLAQLSRLGSEMIRGKDFVDALKAVGRASTGGPSYRLADAARRKAMEVRDVAERAKARAEQKAAAVKLAATELTSDAKATATEWRDQAADTAKKLADQAVDGARAAATSARDRVQKFLGW